MYMAYKGHLSWFWTGIILLNVHKNDIFYFMEIFDLDNYADDNTLSIISSTIQLVN